MKIIELTLLTGRKIYINAKHIESFSVDPDGDTNITTHDNHPYIVKESPKEVMKRIRKANMPHTVFANPVGHWKPECTRSRCTTAEYNNMTCEECKEEATPEKQAVKEKR